MNEDPDQKPPPRTKRRRTDLSVRNLQRRHSVDSRKLGAFLRDVAASTDADDRAATVALVADERIRALNRDYRGHDKPTDVLAFSSGDADEPNGPPYLGDIVISVETAERQARRRGSELSRELKVLVLHGFLHLLGYDHETDEGEMRRVEYRLRRRFGITRARARRGRKP
jgi:probable rRNA maturation factor